MWEWTKMRNWRKSELWGRVDKYSRQLLPSVAPWIQVPSGIWIFVAFVHACADKSPQKLFVFVVIPVALWIGFLRNFGSVVYGPTFAPSFVAALITIMTTTHYLQLSSATSGLYNALFGASCVTLGASFWRIILSDPGRVPPVPNSYALLSNQRHLDVGDVDSKSHSTSFITVIDVDNPGEGKRHCNICNVKQPLRSKHCKNCNVCIERFDHHCPAIGNCIGRKNHVQFLGLIVVFIFTELFYVHSCVTYFHIHHAFGKSSPMEAQSQEGRFDNDLEFMWINFGEVLTGDPWVLSTSALAGIQTVWQVPFLMFHIYCACHDLTTDEMFHWDKYPGLYVETPPAPAIGRPFVGKHFLNPYTKGIRQNLISFFECQS